MKICAVPQPIAKNEPQNPYTNATLSIVVELSYELKYEAK